MTEPASDGTPLPLRWLCLHAVAENENDLSGEASAFAVRARTHGLEELGIKPNAHNLAAIVGCHVGVCSAFFAGLQGKHVGTPGRAFPRRTDKPHRRQSCVVSSQVR